jgi:tetratricopeptide (TPR) repeat protein
MLRALEELTEARRLADTGHHAAVVDLLEGRPPAELRGSPTLALLYGTAQARLGREQEGTQWVEIALDRSRERGDRSVESRALNARGAIALVAGRIDEAAQYFTQALAAARRDGDHATVGRCSNNLGIIHNLRGQYAQAIGSYTMAIAAFQQAGLRNGIAWAHHNLAITYSEQRDFQRALEETDRAVAEARATDDRSLMALTLRGRAEVRILLRDIEIAAREVQLALQTHREMGDVVEEAQDLRILAAVQTARGENVEAERLLHNVIDSAEAQGRPQLVAEASRDLAHLLLAADRTSEAHDAARAARSFFDQLGAVAEIRKIDKVFV